MPTEDYQKQALKYVCGTHIWYWVVLEEATGQAKKTIWVKSTV